MLFKKSSSAFGAEPAEPNKPVHVRRTRLLVRRQKEARDLPSHPLSKPLRATTGRQTALPLQIHLQSVLCALPLCWKPQPDSEEFRLPPIDLQAGLKHNLSASGLLPLVLALPLDALFHFSISWTNLLRATWVICSFKPGIVPRAR